MYEVKDKTIISSYNFILMQYWPIMFLSGIVSFWDMHHIVPVESVPVLPSQPDTVYSAPTQKTVLYQLDRQTSQ